MAGGVLEIIGILALLAAVCELAARWLAARSTQAELRRQHEVLSGYPPAGDPCPWPRLEPELEQLRRTGVL